MAAAVTWNLVSLRSQTLAVTYLNDSSLHEQMVRFATAQLRAGHLPLTSWFPYLSLGSPQFLHYQSLPAMIAGAAGLLIGPDAAFRWSGYLLLSIWPVSVYLGARLLGACRGAAGAAAAASPFLWSAIGIGYEQHAYVWTGYGVWTQLWASLTLPLAWGCSWRAIRDRGHTRAAVILTALTVALHFETGYLALMMPALWPLVAGRPIGLRYARAALVLGGSLLAVAWVIVPLLAQSAWAAQNEALRGTPLVVGYGAGRVLSWLASGDLLDHGRLPVITACAWLGLVWAISRARRDASARAALVALAACLLLSFGPATLGPLAGAIPGAGDIFFRRFMMGVQLASLLLAGSGAAAAARVIWRTTQQVAGRLALDPVRRLSDAPAFQACASCAAAVLVLAPAWIELNHLDERNAQAIAAQRHADATDGRRLARLMDRAQTNDGRVYAGEPTNWGMSFTVGAVPVFKYLESLDIQEVGYTLRTASLMTGPEYDFDDTNPADYELFGVRYLVVPSGYQPPVPARLVARDGQFTLWRVAEGGELHGGAIAGIVNADRTDLGLRSTPLLHSPLAERGEYLSVAYHGGPPQPLPETNRRPAGETVIAASPDLARGRATATVRMRTAGVVVLSASYDPGWKATVDGRRRPTVMVAPALVGVNVPAGRHRITFRYVGYRGYGWLLALGALVLLVTFVGPIHLRDCPRWARSASRQPCRRGVPPPRSSSTMRRWRPSARGRSGSRSV